MDTTTLPDISILDSLESEVRSYCRSWPTVFDTARGAWITDEAGREYLDFFAGAGSLNYGHNNPVLKRALLSYLERDGITHGLDMSTAAKRHLLETFEDTILRPRGLPYEVQFPGPTGMNAVESALKLARKVTGRESIVSFTNAFHGMTLGSLSVTGNAMKRAGAGIPLVHATPMPFDNYLGEGMEDFQWFARLLDDSGSGLNRPAAVIVETVQGEGGVNVARPEWLRSLAELCTDRDILLIVDDVQMGCGRTGPFFSFETAGIEPDIVTLSKSIGGYGLPLALTLFKRELDVWSPGEHNGTFRGNNPAFVTAQAALEQYWSDDHLEKSVSVKGEEVHRALDRLSSRFHGVSTAGAALVRIRSPAPNRSLYAPSAGSIHLPSQPQRPFGQSGVPAAQGGVFDLPAHRLRHERMNGEPWLPTIESSEPNPSNDQNLWIPGGRAFPEDDLQGT